MQIQQLAYFAEAYRCQNMSMASRNLLVSQPSISMAIQGLEQEFETALFVRQGKRIISTKDGDLLFSMVSQLLNQVDIISKTMRDNRLAKPSVNLGVTPMLDELLLMPVLKTFTQKHPDVAINVHEQGSGYLLKALGNDEIDCAMLTHLDPLPKDYSSFPIMNAEVVFCTQSDIVPTDQFFIGVPQLSKLPLIMFRGDFLITRKVHHLFEKENVPVDKLNVFYTDQLSTVENYISNGIKSGFLYRPLAERMENINIYSLDPPLFIQTSFAWKDGLQKYTPMRIFLQYLQKFILNHSSE